MGTAALTIAAAIVTAAGGYLVARAQFHHKLAEVRAERRRDVYTRLLRWLLRIRDAMAEVGRSLRAGTPTLPNFAETLRDFEAELLIDGSDRVRDLMEQITPTFDRFLQRLGEIAAADQGDPNRASAEEHVLQAYDETVGPLVEQLPAAMRAELA